MSIQEKSIDSSKFLSILDLSPTYPKFFWEDREKKKKILAIGMEKASYLIPSIESSNEIWISLLPFHQDSTLTFPWEDWSLPYFYQPSFALVEEEEKIKIFGEYNFHQSASLSSKFFQIEKQWDNPSFPLWEKSIKKAIQSIPKVVLAKCSKYNTSSQICPWELLSNNPIGYPPCFRFAIAQSKESSFVGFSPERLFKREKGHLFSESIAGTIEKKKTSESSLNPLQQSKKDIAEFLFVQNFVTYQMEKICRNVTIGKRTTIEAGNLQHLHTPIQGNLLEGVCDKDIFPLIHPTPATLGFPREKAISFIQEEEKFSRGLYAGAIGYMTKEKSDLCVGLRSLLINGPSFYTFAGGGIVEGSDPLAEWEELEKKEKTILSNLNVIQ